MMHKLSKDEIAYFYELLYKYEYDSRAGYQDDKLDTSVDADVSLDDKHQKNDNITVSIDNTLQFTPYYNNKCWAILYHVRNAFAHGNIQSVDNDNSFLIQDFSDKKKRQKCNMLAKIEKTKFYDLIKAIESAKKSPLHEKVNKKSNTNKP